MPANATSRTVNPMSRWSTPTWSRCGMGEGRLKADSRSALQSRDDDGRGAARDGEDESLDGELADDAGAARAERRAHADLTLAIGRACQEERRDVEARDEEHHADHGERDPRVWREATDLGVPVGHRREDQGALRIGVGTRGGEPGRDTLEVTARLRGRHAWRETSDDRQPRLAALEEARRQVEHLQTVEWNPEIRLVQASWSLETIGQYADDRDDAPVERERSARDARPAAERVGPEPRAHHRRHVGRGAIGVGEDSADCWCRAQRREVVGGDEESPDLARTVAVEHAERHPAFGRDRFESARAAGEVLVVRQ